MLFLMVCAGLLMYFSTALFFTIGFMKYPRRLHGYLISFVPPTLLMYSIISRCAAARPDCLGGVFTSVIIGILAGGAYLYKSRVFEAKR